MHKLIDGIRIAYDDRGVGPATVLIHGFPLDRTIWDDCFEQLSAVGRVIRIDLRGSGESGRGEGPALMETLAGDLYGLLDALDIERAIVAGHSMGGYVALAFFRMYAERVAGLALVASQAGADSPQRRRERDAQVTAIAASGMTAAADAFVANGFDRQFAAAHPEAVERVRSMALRQDPVGAAAQIIGMKERVDSADLLEDITVPALIVAGSEDRFVPLETLESTAAEIRDCEFNALPRVGHLPMLEAPAATTAALARLIARSVDAPRDPQNVRATRA